MKRPVLIITALAAILTVAYNLNRQDAAIPGKPQAVGAPPALVPPPALEIHKPDKSAIALLEVWNLKPFTPAGKMPSLKDMFKPFYTLNRNGRFESLGRSDRLNESWEFQGVLMRGNTPRALFYNAGLKKMKNLGANDRLDDQLKVRAIGASSVTVEVTTDKKPQLFVLRVFNANRELYATKKKTH